MTSEKQCSACNWCFPICCCTGDQLHIPLAILSVLMVLSAFGSVADLGDDTAEWDYYGTGAEIMAWLLAILNIIAPLTFFVSLFDRIKPSIKRILVMVFFIYLVIDAILIFVFAIIFFVLAGSLDTADCLSYLDDSTTTTDDYESFCDFITTFLNILAVMFLIICLIHVNWAGATWYYYSNNIDGSDNRLLPTTSGKPTGGQTKYTTELGPV